jgi:RNA exonuclease 1
VLAGLLNVIPSHQFTFGRLMALATILGCKLILKVLALFLLSILSLDFFFPFATLLMDVFFCLFVGVTPKVTPDSLLVQDPLLEPTPSVLEPVISSLNSHLKTLQASLPAKTALIIFTGHSDPRRMSALNMQKSTFDTAYKSGKTPEELRKDGITWSAGDGRELEREVELARRGLLFLGVKQ